MRGYDPDPIDEFNDYTGDAFIALAWAVLGAVTVLALYAIYRGWL